MGIIEDRLIGGRVDEIITLLMPAFIRLKNASDLGGDDELVAGLVSEESTEPRFAEAEAVKGGGIKIAQPRIPRRLKQCGCLVIRQWTVEITQRRCPEPEGRQPFHGRSGYAQWPHHAHPPDVSYT